MDTTTGAPSKQRFSKKQKLWLANYQRCSGYEPMYMDDFKIGKCIWEELVSWNLNWLELHHQTIQEQCEGYET